MLVHADLDAAQDLLYEFSQTCGVENMNPQCFNSALTGAYSFWFGFTIPKIKKGDPKRTNSRDIESRQLVSKVDSDNISF